MELVRKRLLNQQLVSPQFDTPEQVVSHFGAMQAQEYRLMRWSVMMRTRKPSADVFKNAFDAGKIIRLHLLRGTWQLVAKEDYWWMLEMFAPKAEKVILGWMSANGITLPQDERNRILDILLRTASDLGSATSEDFARALNEKDIVMDTHRLSYHIRMAELGGQLCSGDLLPMKATYSITEMKIGRKEIKVDRDEALRLLALKYFRSHSPASLQDFVWWSGLGVGDCRKAMALLGDNLHKYELSLNDRRTYGYGQSLTGRPAADQAFYVLDSCRTKGFRSGKSLLLPSYDEYLIGYKSRFFVLPEKYKARAHNNSGNFSPIVAHDGIICGNWAPFAKEMKVDYFQNDTQPFNESEDWQRYIRGCRGDCIYTK